MTVFAERRTTFHCKECKREWVKLDGDVIIPPEPCPFCEVTEMAHRFSCVLEHATGGRMSKTNIVMSQMRSEIDGYYQDLNDGYITRLNNRIHELEEWLRIYMLLRRTHKDHRRALLVVNKKLRAGVASLAWMLGSHPQLLNETYRAALDIVLLDKKGGDDASDTGKQ